MTCRIWSRSRMRRGSDDTGWVNEKMQAAHQRQSRALGRKVSDEFTVPLCRGHHREVHRSGDEAAWWGKAGIDPNVAARALWLETHPFPAISDKKRVDQDPASRLVSRSDPRQTRHDRPPGKRGPNHETKPIEKATVSQ